MSGYKQVRQEASIADAVSAAFSELEELGNECREVVDNASEGLSQTQRIQTLDETASTLEGISEPTVPDDFGDIKIGYIELTKRRGVSRSARRDNAVAKLSGVVDACEEELEKFGDEENRTDEHQTQYEAIELLRDDCQQLLDEAEGCEFPGMYG